MLKLKDYKSLGIVTISLIVGAIISFIALPFLTRIYSVAEFGLYGLALSIVSVLSTFFNLRFDQALLVADSLYDKKCLMLAGLLSTLIFSLLAFPFIYFLSLQDIGASIILGVISNSLFQSFYNYNFSIGREIVCGALNIFRSVNMIAFQLGLPLIYKLSLVDNYSFQSIFIISLLFLYMLINKYFNFSFIVYSRYKDFMFSNAPHALLSSFSHNLPYYLVTNVAGLNFTGQYAIVERTLRLPINLLSQTFRQFFIRYFSQNKQLSDPNRISLIFSLISLPFFLSFFFIPDSVYTLIFGNKWKDIGDMFKILTLGFWAVFTNPPVSAFIISKRKGSVLFKLQIVELIIKILLFVALYYTLRNYLILIAVPISLIIYNFSLSYYVWRNKACSF